MINNITKLLSNSNTSVIKNQTTVYNFNKQNNVSIGPGWKNRVTILLTAYFKKFYCLISKPVFIITPNSVKIHLFYYKRAASLRKISYLKRLIKSLLSPSRFKGSSAALLKRNRIKIKGLSHVSHLSHFRDNLPRFYVVRSFNSWAGRYFLFPNFRLKYIAILLSKLLQTNVELELVRLKYPYHDSNILAQLIGINGRTSTYGRIKKRLFGRATIFTKDIEKKDAKYGTNTTSLKGGTDMLAGIYKKEVATLLTGIKIRISGRLARQRVVPKRTVKTAYKGGIAKSKNNLVDQSTYTSKNKKGAFSVRVWLSHGINN